jgi:hypothetical protein
VTVDGGGFNGIIARLEKQRDAIESALSALHDLAGISPTNSAIAPGKRGRGRPRKIA